MTRFEIHTLESAPEASRPILEATKRGMGRIPNLFGVFAEAPAILEAYTSVSKILETSSAFDATELQTVLLSASYKNECDYCMAAHTAIAGMQKVDQTVVQSLRDGTPLSDPKLEALRRFTQAVVEQRGFVAGDAIEAFLAVGYTNRHVLEVILGVGFKTLSNYVNHIAETPLDRAFQPFAWEKPEGSTAAAGTEA